ncbi:MAG TPA: SHOCT domain-containing protein [Parasegetibacter sp.]
MNFQTMNRQRKFMLIAGLLGVISIFLPWFSIPVLSNFFGGGSSSSMNGFRGWGIVIFLCYAGTVVMALIGDQIKSLDKTTWLIAIAAGAIALLLNIITISRMGGDSFGFMKPGFGLWISLVAAIGIAVSVWLFRSPDHNIASSFDALKKNIATSTSSLGASHSNGSTSRVDELEKLIDLRNQGKITEAEYEVMKAKIM